MINVEIFKTNIQQKSEADDVYKRLSGFMPDAKINFDLDDCDKILRIEDLMIDLVSVVSIVEDLGFICKPIPDKICTKSINSAEGMSEFWENSFVAHNTMWGFEPANSAIITKDFFLEQGIKDVLVPGIGYGRNARPFVENQMNVTGIEISGTAIQLAREKYGFDMELFEGSVTEMPFNNTLYEGIFCYGLLYLLNPEQRIKLITDCYKQLKPGGWMVFSVLSKNSANFGKGKVVGKDTFEVVKGAEIFFYDTRSVVMEFGKFGLQEFFEIDEQNDPVTKKPSFKFIVIKCTKPFNA